MEHLLLGRIGSGPARSLPCPVVTITRKTTTMGIFSRIRDSIFGRRAEAATTTPSASATTAGAKPGQPGATAGAGQPGQAQQQQQQQMQQVDVEAVLSGLAAQSSQKLNWRTSIVDLMKLLGMESSLAERKELAQELGYTGSTSDTATMNIWLHKQVMKKLAENGGKVPADLLD